MVMYAHVVIDEHMYVIPHGQVLVELTRRLLAAVRNGGEFVPVPAPGTGAEVLVAPGTSIRIEHIEVEDHSSETSPEPQPYDTSEDYEWWL
ncbi:hypothetical protein ACPW96_18215 [Micromonospora sp. DT81.3]|uniref:hypothetical protein n=1 Tax=Micromonospora sp. DT81.3 TaxID=3416523 RepID=UPI003CF23374